MKKNTYIIIAVSLLVSAAALSFIFSGKSNAGNEVKDSIPASLVSKVDTTAKKQKPKKKKVKPKPQVKVDSSLFTNGVVTDKDSLPMKGVIISDGYTCVATDSDGYYALNRNPKARFIYYTVPADCEVPVHSSTDNTAYFYQPVEKNKNSYDFELTRMPGGVEKIYKMIVIGDPQITNAYSPYFVDGTDNKVQKSDLDRFQDETMSDIKQTISGFPAGMPVYGLSMGDNVQYYGGYNEKLEGQIRAALGSSSMKLFSVIGNHDQDGVPLYKQKWEESFGPTDFSFDRGDVHYICINNVHYRNKTYWQPGELTADQLKWLASDLSFVDHSKKIVLSYHVPFTSGNRPIAKKYPLGIATEKGHYYSTVFQKVMKLLAPFEGGVELFCGHTHFGNNHDVKYQGKTIIEHCHAAACGNIWQSNINICGTPNGYYVYSVNGTKISNSYYKGTFWNASQQMALFEADTDFNGESYSADWNIEKGKHAIVANVFNADYRWKVVAVENGVEFPMTRISSKGQDAFAAGYHHKYSESVNYWFISKNNGYLIMNHLYYYVPKSTTSEIVIKATDPYGNVYTDNAKNVEKEPFYNYAHYYKKNEK